VHLAPQLRTIPPGVSHTHLNPGERQRPVATSTRFVNNTFGRDVAQKCGAYGPVTSYASGGGNAWTGNVWIDGGTVTP